MTGTFDTSSATVVDALLGASSDGLLILRDGQPLVVNVRLCELLGLCRESLLRDGLAAAAWPEEARAAVAAVAAGGQARREATLDARGPDPTPVTLTATRVAGEGAAALVVLEVRDATERELAFDTIALLDERLRRLADAAPVALWSTDLEGLCTYVSPRWTEITGQAMEDALGVGWREVVHPDDREGVRAAWHDWHPEHRETRALEYRVVRPDGEVRFIVDATRRVYGVDGRPMGYAGASMDVTESRVDRQRLGALADRNAALAELGRRALAHDTSLDDLLRAAGAAVHAALGTDWASVGRLTEDGQYHELVALHVRDVGPVPAGQRIPVGRFSQAGLAMHERRPIATGDVEHEDRYDTAQLTEHGVRASIAVPILPAGRVYGSLGAHFLQPREIDGDEVNFLVAVANVVAGLEERLRVEEEQRRAALVDPLTGLANRVVVRDVIARELVARDRGRWPAVLLIDVDHISHVNHAYGQAVGDELLVAIGRRLSDLAGPEELVGRLTSDEFAVVCQDSGTSAALLAERVLDAFAEPFGLRRGPLSVSVSIGIATSRGTEASADALLRGAEAAASAAKTRGRARLEWYDQELGQRARVQVETALALRRAVEEDELSLVYQPVVHLPSGEVDGYEALVRWQRAGEDALVTPDRFIPIAEETGLIVQVGRRVLEAACAQLARWNAQRGDQALRVSINVSGRELARPEFAAGVLRVVRETGVDPAQLALELTESALVEESDAALAALDEVRAAGVRLHIDDFGTGYASLAYLKRFRPDELKLDRSFVTGLGEAGADTTIVAAIVGMAHALGLEVTGEGVERPEQLAALRALGCERAQGYLFARPGDAPVFPGPAGG